MTSYGSLYYPLHAWHITLLTECTFRSGLTKPTSLGPDPLPPAPSSRTFPPDTAANPGRRSLCPPSSQHASSCPCPHSHVHLHPQQAPAPVPAPRPTSVAASPAPAANPRARGSRWHSTSTASTTGGGSTPQPTLARPRWLPSTLPVVPYTCQPAWAFCRRRRGTSTRGAAASSGAWGNRRL